VGRLPTKKTITALVSDHTNPQILYASSADGVLKSQDAGASWQAMNTGLSDTQVAALVLRFRNNVRVFGTISPVKTTCSPAPNWRGICGAQHLALHPTQPARLYAVTAHGTVFRSTDGAATWQRQGQLPTE